jgi:HlyD family secretion protein
MALLPDAVPVDIVTVDRGTVDVVVEEDGRTHVRDRYILTSPVAGAIQRVEVRAGDRVHAGDVLARIDGPEAGIPDSRTMEQLRIRVGAAEARVAQARAMVEAGEAALVEAREELRRLEVLASVGGGSASALERASALVRVREAELRSATFGVQVAESEAQDLRAALARPPAEGEPGTLELRSPVGGSVLRVHRQSAGAVAPGEALVEVGDPEELEIVVDLLSADAVRVPPGAEARITGWGGDTELEARVRRVEPSGFTRVSALGIEEQRVNVILDLEGDAQEWLRLGDGFRVEARILLARAEDVLRVPTAALFRRGDGWAVFRVEGARTLETPITIGRRSQAEAEVLSGLEVGDRVVVYPGDRVAHGVRVEER